MTSNGTSEQGDEMHEEYSPCPEPGCDGTLRFPAPEGCSCHISPPCGACTSVVLTCTHCGWTEPPAPEQEVSHDRNPTGIVEFLFRRPSHDLGNGKRIFDYDYDSSSGSAMEYRGRYEGPVTAQDIIDTLGDGTFGHRGPWISGGRFTYTKITD